MKALSIRDIQALKGKRKLAAVSTFSYPMAQLAQDAEIDVILVGDSLGMAELGMDSTLHVDIHHGAPYRSGCSQFGQCAHCGRPAVSRRASVF